MDSALLREIVKDFDFGNGSLFEKYKSEQEVQRLFADFSIVRPFNKYSTNTLREILKRAVYIQLENRCKVECKFCGFDFNPKQVKYEQFEVETLRELKRRKIRRLEGLYVQAEPFNFKGPIYKGSNECYSYLDIHRMIP